MARTYSRMANPMRAVSGMASKDGDGIGIRMAMSMKESGRMISRTGKVQCGTPIWISMKGSGLRARRMDGASTFITMVLFIKATFSTVGSKASAQ